MGNATGDDVARPSDNGRTSHGKTLVRTCLGCGLSLPWTPLLCFVRASTRDCLLSQCFMPVVVFFLAAFISHLLIHFSKERNKAEEKRSVSLDLVASASSLASAGTLIAALTVDRASVLLPAIALGLGGVSCSISFLCWEHVLARLRYKEAFAAVACITVTSGTMFSLFISKHAYLAGTCVWGSVDMLLCGFGSIATVVSLLIKPTPPPPSLSEHPLRSKMLNGKLRRFRFKYSASWFLLGFVTTAMVSLFACSTYTTPTMTPSLGALVGIPVFFLMAGIGWLPNKKLHPLIPFRLLVIISIVAFFPIQPGTQISFDLAVLGSTIWCVSLFGCFFFLNSTVENTLSRIGYTLYGVGMASLSLGSGTGLLFMYAISKFTPFFSKIVEASLTGIAFACLAGAIAVSIVFCSTNLLINEESLKQVRLTAKKRFGTILPFANDLPAPSHELRDTPPTQSGILVYCKQIALDYKLTPREFEVLAILAHGHTLARVESELVISEGTAITHRRNIYRKLNVHSKQELLDFIEGRVHRLTSARSKQ